jgi:plasmid stabilization system protein ParE
MTWRITAGPEARADYYSAVDHYTIEAAAQVPRFRAEVREAIRAIRDYPFLSSDRGDGVRRRAIAVFPYHLWYKVYDDEETIRILAVRHFRQDPTRVGHRV